MLGMMNILNELMIMVQSFSSDLKVICDNSTVILAKLITLTFREDIPESKCFITSSRNNSLPIRRLRQIQHSFCMPMQSRDLLHSRIIPNSDMIIVIPMRTDNLISVFREI